MTSKLFSILTRLSSTSSMQPTHRLFKLLIRTPITTRSYHTGQEAKVTLYSKISPLGNPEISVVPELDDWVQKGKEVGVSELKRLVYNLRKRKRFTQALEISEWMNKRDICAFTPTEHAVQLDLIGRVRGFLSAETYFNNLTDQDKTEKTYGALLNCYTRQHEIAKSFSHLQKMKEMGFASSPLTYNAIMCLYTNISQYEKIPNVLTEMKQNKVSPDNYSYRICINSYGARNNIEGIDELIKEMESESQIVVDWNTYSVAANFYLKARQTDKAIDCLKKSEEKLDKKDGLGYNHLISLYAKLGNKNEVLRLWGLEKSACKRCINRDYITMLESLVKLGELEEAENVLKEWESSGNCYDNRVPNTVITGYTEKGFFEKAESMLEDLMKKGRACTPNGWGIVAKGYFEKGEMEKAVECMKVGLSLYEGYKGWNPNQRVVMGLLNWLGDNCGVEDVEAFVGLLKGIVPVNREMYHALIKAGIRSGKEVDGILKRMKDDEIDEDEETKKILSTGQDTI